MRSEEAHPRNILIAPCGKSCTGKECVYSRAKCFLELNSARGDMQRDLKSELAVSLLVSERKVRKREEKQVGNGKRSTKGRKKRRKIALWQKERRRERERERDARLALRTSEISGETGFRFVSKNITQLNRLERRN